MLEPEVLVMTVGRGEDTRRVETLYDSMKKSMALGKWRRVFLLPSSDTVAIARELISHVNQNREEQLPIEVGLALGPGEHDDEDKCFAHFDRILGELIQSGEDPATIVFDYTRGTKPMSAAAVLACVSRGVDKIRYVTGKRGSNGMIIPGTEAPQEGHTSAALFRRDLDRAKILVFNGQFEQARLLLDELGGSALVTIPEPGAEPGKQSLHPVKPGLDAASIAARLTDDERREVRSGYLLARFWGAWDRFYYRQASGIIPQLTAVHPFWSEAEPLPRHLEMIRSLAQDVPLRPSNISVQRFQDYARQLIGVHERLTADLIENAWRRWWRGDYEDTLIRAFRAQELLGHLRLCRKGILPSDVCLDDPSVKRWLRTGTFRGSPIKLYRNELSKPMVASLLTFLGDQWFKEHGSKGWDKLRSRNQSPLTHGLRCQTTKPESLKAMLLELEKVFESESPENADLLRGAQFLVPEMSAVRRAVSEFARENIGI